MVTEIKRWPTLYKKANKKWMVWNISVQGSTIYMESGYEGMAQTLTTRDCEPKNVGRANATTAEEQAISEAQSRWEKQHDKNYADSKSDANAILLPMLAHPYGKYAHKVKWPAYVQPKLNGMRCLAFTVNTSARPEMGEDGHHRFISRRNKPINTVEHLAEDLHRLFGPDKILDGELYIHGTSLQQIRSILSNESEPHPRRPEVEYWVYDAPHIKGVYADRHDYLFSEWEICKGLGSLPGRVKICPTVLCHNERQMIELHNAWVQEGFEGAIIRSASGRYEWDQRSHSLLKYKEFHDEEFEIVGGEKDASGGVVFHCKTAEGKVFKVRPKGTEGQRAHWLSDIDNIVGKMLTVRYQELSDENIPTIVTTATAEAIRDYE